MTTNWNNPTLTSNYLVVLDELKERDKDCALMFDNVDSTSIPTSAIGWKAENNRFEKYNGSVWSQLSASYNINVTNLGGEAASYYTDASNMSTGTLPSAVFNNTSHGNRGGGALHSIAVAGGAAGFISGADKEKIDNMNTLEGSEVFALVLEEDGEGSGLDANLLNGINGSEYATKTFVQSDIASSNKISAWIYFNGIDIPTINDSYNILAISDMGVGVYNFTFCDNLPNNNYALIGNSYSPEVGGAPGSKIIPAITEQFFTRDASNVTIETTYEGSHVDPRFVSIIIAGIGDCV